MSDGFRLERRLLRQILPYWRHLAGVLLLSLLSPPIALLAPLPLKIVVDSVIESRPLPRVLEAWLPAAVPRSPEALLLFAVLLVIAVALLGQLRDLASTWLTTYTGEKLLRGLRAQLFAHLQRLSLAYHDTRGAADSLYRIQYDAASVQRITIEGIIPFIGSAFTLLAMAYVTIRIDWQLALVALAVSPAVFAISRAYRRRLRARSRAVKAVESSALGVVQEALGAVRVVKAFGQERREEQRFAERSDEGMRARLALQLAEGGFGLLVALVTALGAAAVLFVGVRGVKSGALTLGDLLLVMGYVAQLHAPLRTISRKAASMQSHLAGTERAFAVLDESPEVVERPQALALARARGAMAFRNVTFAYDDGRPALSGISFELEPGTRLGISGTTGAGKTTLVNLLCRFYDPTGGEILLDGVDLRDYRLADLRQQFAIVLQEPVLFSTTVAENIAFARPGARTAEIVAAAEAANAHDFIVRLPHGYDTLVGERGMRLSGGERQRIALARAFLKDAPLLILDEPTSSVDVRTEASIVQAMEQLTRGRTTFVITHRESALEHCDLLLRIEGGRVVALEHPRRAAAPLRGGGSRADGPVLEQRALEAWRQACPAGFDLERVESVKLKRKTAVLRLVGRGARPPAVIAKRCRTATAHVERAIYEEFLTHVPLPALRCRGFVPEPEGEFCWLFMDDAGAEPYSPASAEHRALAGRWLGAIHGTALSADLRGRLPERGAGHYLTELRASRLALLHHAANPVLSAEEVRLLRTVTSQCDVIEEHWAEVERWCDGSPPVLVHGDFVIKNVRVQGNGDGPALLVFDWEMAGWGMPGTDLAQFVGGCASPDLDVYRAALGPAFARHDAGDIRQAAAYGAVLRLVDKIFWETLTAVNDSYRVLQQPLSSLARYQPELGRALQALAWRRHA